MKQIIQFMVVLVLTASRNALAEEANPAADQFHVLVQSINAKIAAGKTNQPDLKDELESFDRLIAMEKAVNQENAAYMVYLKAKLYAEVFGEIEQGEAILRQLKA